ncbi:TetR/AcrR family transcriptional regulator C-terminal domain-containing protein [Gordonia sp. NPDC003376]
MQRRARNDGERTRAALLNAAIPLFLERDFDKVSVAEVAAAAEAFPNQVTYHFGGKEALFVEAACRAVLRTAMEAERRTRASNTPDEHRRTLMEYLLGSGAGAVALFADAMLMARRKEPLREMVRGTVHELHVAGEAAMVDTFRRTGWPVRASPESITRGFWTVVLGLALEKAALGQAFDDTSTDAALRMLAKVNAPDETDA